MKSCPTSDRLPRAIGLVYCPAQLDTEPGTWAGDGQGCTCVFHLSFMIGFVSSVPWILVTLSTCNPPGFMTSGRATVPQGWAGKDGDQSSI